MLCAAEWELEFPREGLRGLGVAAAAGTAAVTAEGDDEEDGESAKAGFPGAANTVNITAVGCPDRWTDVACKDAYTWLRWLRDLLNWLILLLLLALCRSPTA